MITNTIMNSFDIDSLDIINNNLLSINEFLIKINYRSNHYFDKFWNFNKNNDWIYLDEELILWMGYKDLRRGKECSIKLLKKYFIEFEDFKILNDKEFIISNFYENSLIKNKSKENRGAHKRLHIILSSNSFKEICMFIGTSASKEIKKYYIEIEKLYKLYSQYQNKYNLYILNKLNEEKIQKINEDLDLSNQLLTTLCNKKDINNICGLYLCDIGSIKELRYKMNICKIKYPNDNHRVKKIGKSKDIINRFRQHKATYGKINPIKLELFIDLPLCNITNAENTLKELCNKYLFDYNDGTKNHKELVIVSSTNLLEGYYKLIKKEYPNDLDTVINTYSNKEKDLKIENLELKNEVLELKMKLLEMSK